MSETSVPVNAGQPSGVGAAGWGGQPILRIEGVEQRFLSKRGDVAALGPVSFSVKEGTFVSIVGPSGCGKSTLLKILYGVVPPSSGRVLFRGEPLADHQSSFGMMFQSPVLLPWRSTLQNVLLPLEVLKRKNDMGVARARKLLEMVGVAEFADHYPRELSGGMRQRVAMCRTLVHDPEMLLLDEPFGALDSLTREQLNDDLLRIWSQTRKTIAFVTHDISEAVYLSDRVLVMSKRPGTIRDEVAIDLPRPRNIETRRDPSFEEYGARIRTALGLAR